MTLDARRMIAPAFGDGNGGNNVERPGDPRRARVGYDVVNAQSGGDVVVKTPVCDDRRTTTTHELSRPIR